MPRDLLSGKREPKDVTRLNRHMDFDGSNIPGYNPETGWVDKNGVSGAAALGAADVASFGFGDEISSALVAPFVDEDRETILRQMRASQDAAWQDHPYAYATGGVGGAVAGGALLGPFGFAGNAARSGGTLGRVAAGSAVDGALFGALQGAGSGEDMESRAKRAAVGSIVGLGTGAVAPFAVAGGSAAARNLAARFRPDAAAEDALGGIVGRSGLTPDEIANALRAAQTDGQGMYMAADALGHAGQRAASTVARNPNDMRQALVEALDARQAGQGRRIAGALEDGFGGPMTALQQEAATTALRRAQGNANYGAAREAAGAVDPTAAIAAIDNVIAPGVTPMIGAGAADNSVYGSMSRMRGLLTDGKSQVSDFDRALMAKMEMDALIENGGTVSSLLRPARGALDDALASSSAPYATARDTYRQQSQALDAVQMGRDAAARGRIEDTIPAFRSLPPEAQANYRAGYVDPYIEAVQGAAVGVNKARPLINDATAAEFPAFAKPGMADQLGRRITREQEMFATRGAATGGSRTADNLADAVDLSQFDPSILTNLLQGRPLAAALNGVSRAVNEARGMPPSVLTRVAKALMETDPDAAKQLLTAGAGRAQTTAERRRVATAIINAMGGTGGGRLVSP